MKSGIRWRGVNSGLPRVFSLFPLLDAAETARLLLLFHVATDLTIIA
jgi:hypothetical protein